MTHVPMPALLPCPFCGADAVAEWVMHEAWGRSIRVACSRDGECPSPEWVEAASGYENDASAVAGVCAFWNTRSADWTLDGWQRVTGPKPRGPVLVCTTQRAAERRSDAAGQALHQPYAIAQWYDGQWRDVLDGRIYRVQAWRYLRAPGWL